MGDQGDAGSKPSLTCPCRMCKNVHTCDSLCLKGKEVKANRGDVESKGGWEKGTSDICRRYHQATQTSSKGTQHSSAQNSPK
jgi:hypothetical protein